MSESKIRQGQRTLLIRLIDEAFDKTAWHGTNLRGSIRRVSTSQAAWRPKAGRRNIVEIVLHCAYWKYAVWRRITGGKPGSFPLKGSNWFDTPEDLSDAQWKAYVKLLVDMHRSVREAVATAAWGKIASGPGGNANSPAAHVHGAAMHDLYHAGQIQTLKVLYRHG